MSFQEFERKYSYLLSWEDAEKKVGRKLDWNNNFDCCLYHDLLVEAVNAKQMRDYKADFEDTCKLMRRYMKHIQPQRFASVWGIFEKQKKQCELNKVSIDDVSDIYNYAKAEQIEKFGF